MSQELKSDRDAEAVASLPPPDVPLTARGPRGQRESIDDPALARIDRKLRWMIVALFAMVLALLFNVAAVFGAIIDFHAGEGLLIGSACGAGCALGFVFGWLAHAAVRR